MNPDRRQLLAETLERHELDGLIAWRPEEIVMLTGTHPHWGLSVALVVADDDPLLLVPRLEPPVGRRGLAVETFPWGEAGAWEGVVQKVSRWTAGRRVAWKGATGHASLPGNFAENPPWPPSWPSCLPGMRCDEAMDELLAVKTPADLEALRLTHRVAEHALEVFRAAAQPGATEAEVAATVEAGVLRHTGRPGIATSRAWACVQSGTNTADAGRFNRSTGRVLAPGDRVLMEIAVCVNGYWADLTESLVCGGGQEDRPLLSLVSHAARAALAVIRPGALAGDVDRAAREVIASGGQASVFTHATGHPTGFRYHDPGPVLGAGSTDKLTEGMVLTVEPGIYLPDGGVRLESNVFVTSRGCEILGGGTLAP